MVFTTHIFVFYFLPVFLLVYFNLPYRWRNFFITCMSYIFYGWWKPWFVILMMMSTVLDYICGGIIAQPGASATRRRAALITAIFAAILAISSLGGSKAMKEMILAQQQASDQWSYYQAKAGREHLYRGQKMLLELNLLEKETLKPEARQRYEELLKQVTSQVERYANEEKTIEKEARALEHERDLARNKDPYFEFSEALLQIAIIMASVAILSQSRAILGVAIVAASLGTFLWLDGFFLFFHLPFLSP